MKRKVIIFTLIISILIVSFPLNASAATVPVITTPYQRSAVNANQAVTIRWNAPTGTVSNYVLSVRHLSGNTENAETDAFLIVKRQTLSSGTRNYTIPWSKLAYGSCYRISVCANMSDGSQRWSEEMYFFTATHKVIEHNTISFRFYEGFSSDWKYAIYYAAQAWKSVSTGLDYEVVNTYPTTQCHNVNQIISGDGHNRVTNVLRDADEDEYLAKTFFKRNSSGVMTEADININSHDYNFTVGAQSGYIDLQSVMTHEMGHVAGLAHCFQDFSTSWTMYARTKANNLSKRTIESGDDYMFSTIYITI